MSEMERPLGQAAEQNQTEQTDKAERAGMDAIGEALSRLYPGQEGRYYGAVITARLGGKDPLDGIEVWESGEKRSFDCAALQAAPLRMTGARFFRMTKKSVPALRAVILKTFPQFCILHSAFCTLHF